MSTRKQDFLDGLPLILGTPSFMYARKSLSTPTTFGCVSALRRTSAAFRGDATRLVFINRARMTRVVILNTSNMPRRLTPRSFILRRNGHCVVGPKSIKVPQSGSPHTSCYVFSSGAGIVAFRQMTVSYSSMEGTFASTKLSRGSTTTCVRSPMTNLAPMERTLGFAPTGSRESFTRGMVRDTSVGGLGGDGGGLGAVVALMSLSTTLLTKTLACATAGGRAPTTLAVPRGPLVRVATIHQMTSKRGILPPVPPPAKSGDTAPLVRS